MGHRTDAAVPDGGLVGYDPIFGMRYDPEQVRFEAAPPAVTTGCRSLDNANWERVPSMFAAAEGPGSIYAVIGGFLVLTNPNAFAPPSAVRRGDRIFVPDPNGVVLQRSGADCRIVDKARDLFAYENPDMDKEVLVALSRDVVKRYSAAFGNAERFRTALMSQGVVRTETSAASTVVPVLQQALRPLFSDLRISVRPLVFRPEG